MPYIAVDEGKCVGCHICELICAIYHFDVNNHKKAAIKVISRYPKAVGYDVYVCRQCESATCAQACPTGALFKSDGVLTLRRELCTGCMACLPACPYNAIFAHRDLSFPIICDLCGGDPQCISRCPLGALKLA